MRYQYLLYSRSKRKDYRWMIQPTQAQQADFQVLNSLYQAYDRQKRRSSFSQTDVLPLLLWSLSNIVVLIHLGKIKHTDAYGRDIYGMWGISVSKEESQALEKALCWLLRNHKVLNPYCKHKFENADDLTLTPSEIFYEPHLSGLPFDFDAQAEQVENAGTLRDRNETIEIPFNREGYQELIKWFCLRDATVVNVAFGATERMLRVIPSVRILARA